MIGGSPGLSPPTSAHEEAPKCLCNLIRIIGVCTLTFKIFEFAQRAPKSYFTALVDRFCSTSIDRLETSSYIDQVNSSKRKFNQNLDSPHLLAIYWQ